MDDQFSMISQCLFVQRAKALDAMSSQLSESRVPLEKLAESCSNLKSDICVLLNTHKDALQVSDPGRQLKVVTYQSSAWGWKGGGVPLTRITVKSVSLNPNPW